MKISRFFLSTFLVSMNVAIVQASEYEFSTRIYFQLFGVAQQLADHSVFNPGNVLKIPEYAVRFDFRPDLSIQWGRFDFDFKPRLQSHWQQLESSTRANKTDVDNKLFLNEWRVRRRINDHFFLSYGREDLQWGPSYLLSPSNPFNSNNGRSNNFVEVPGLDYARFTWIPNATWTASLIANIDDGRLDISNFQETYALKLDYTGKNKYFSLIPSVHNDDEDTVSLGFFAGSNALEAWLFYIEGNISENNQRPQGLLGTSYTLEDGSNIAIEYFRQQEGCTLESVALCFPSDTNLSDFSRNNLLGRDYIFLQYFRDWNQDITDLTFRWTRNMNDNSSWLSLNISHEVGEHSELIGLGNLTMGDEDSEFGSLIDYSVWFGVGYIF